MVPSRLLALGRKTHPATDEERQKKKRQKQATKEHKKNPPEMDPKPNTHHHSDASPTLLPYMSESFSAEFFGLTFCWRHPNRILLGSITAAQHVGTQRHSMVEKIQYYNRHIYMYAMDDSTVHLQMCFSTDVDRGVPTAAYWFPFQSKSCSTIRCRGKQKDVTPERGSPELKDYNH